MKRTTRATLTCAECGDRRTFAGTQWEVTVAAQVWQKTHGGVPPKMTGRRWSGPARPGPAAGRRDQVARSDASGNLGRPSSVSSVPQAKRQSPGSRPALRVITRELWQATAPQAWAGPLPARLRAR